MEDANRLELYLSNEIIRTAIKKMDDIFIEGLRRKGFEFKDLNELNSFAKENCRAEDYGNLLLRVYYVNDVPFMEYHYYSEFKINNPKEMEAIQLYCDLGKYKYL